MGNARGDGEKVSRKGERGGEEVTTITAAMHENTKEGRRDGTGGRRIGAPRKNWRGVCVPGDL